MAPDEILLCVLFGDGMKTMTMARTARFLRFKRPSTLTLQDCVRAGWVSSMSWYLVLMVADANLDSRWQKTKNVRKRMRVEGKRMQRVYV